MAPVNVHREILAWSPDRPVWQRDALRRLVAQGQLTDKDIAALVEICKASHGLAPRAEVDPLDGKHIPLAGDGGAPVALTSITHKSGVNMLAPDQMIEFATGLTIVYGDNAAGKSGYTRILKRACRARGAEEILGNVVSGTAPGRPAASIKFTVNGVAQELAWDDDKPADKYLARVSVFDRHCASVYIAEETDVAFRPMGLDLFDKLSDACESVRRVLDREKRDIELSAGQLPTVQQSTAVFDLLSHLTSLTNPDDVRRLGALSEADLATMADLRARLRDLESEDPQKTARALELRAKRVDGLFKKLQDASEVLSADSIIRTFAARNRMLTAAKAAESMRAGAFGIQTLPNTGSEAWRSLWSAAERFSTSDAYPEETFPVTGTNSRCVLCQQKLREDGAERLQKFHEFLSSEVQRERDDAAADFNRCRQRISDFAVTEPATTEVLDEVHLDNPSLGAVIRSYMDVAEYRRLGAVNAIAEEGGPPEDLQKPLPTLPDVGSYILSIRARANELRGTDRSEAIAKVAQPLRELEARQVLGRHLAVVLGEIERKKRIAAYQLCLDDTKTTAITRKSSEVTKAAVTEQLTKSFKSELDALGFKHVEVEMVAAGGSRGALYHKLQLRRAPGVSVPKVVSEGEARCLSIASFFAELSTAVDKSAILFDDPVSSLDHNWRERVAARLVQEAKSRQVIVFTHDVVFLICLADHAKDVGIEASQCTLRRGGTAAGLAAAGVPFRAMKVKDRIGYLKSAHQAVDKLHRDNKPQECEQATIRAYALLRQAWERGVEEVLLNDVVERMRNSIQTQKAVKLSDITQKDCEDLEAGMTKCSKWEGGHDHATAENAPLPSPDDLKKDIEALETWVAAIRKRRN